MGSGSRSRHLWARFACAILTRPYVSIARGSLQDVQGRSWKGFPRINVGSGGFSQSREFRSCIVCGPRLCYDFDAVTLSRRFCGSVCQGEAGEGGDIKKILIANRGEIACRVIRSARKLGVRTVAVYSDADWQAKHVESADEAIYIGPAPASASYLNASAIIAAALSTGAQAIHPGYGFLSESAQFAELCKLQGLIFMGPPSPAIRAMGDKSVAKSMMSAAGVPVVPGYHGENQSRDLLQAEANHIGYPVLIKATQGGGGKGMRIVHTESEFDECLASAQRESQAAFGDSRVLVEKYVSRPRHIEVQIFGDKHGNVVHLYERDCSVQRRHQKIIEEAPAPHITSEFRQRIGQAAVNAAKAVGYESAGTVEFIVDTVSGDFYFMEMNTRLQVEHPVTEMVTGQDLVEWQIRIANGEMLPVDQGQLNLLGHSFEARIYAENVPKGFLPATGQLHHYRPPLGSSTVRVETGVGEGDRVSVFYDPMIAKLVVWGSNRSAALTKLHDCLSQFQVAGVPTNIGFLKMLASHQAFAAGDVDTHFIERFKADLLPFATSPPRESITAGIPEQTVPPETRSGAALAAAAISIKKSWTLLGLTHERQGDSGVGSLWNTMSGFRMNHGYSRMLQLDWKPEAGDVPALPIVIKITHGNAGEYVVEGDMLRRVTISGKELLDDCHNLRLNVETRSATVSLAHYLQGDVRHVHLWEGDRHHQFTVPVPHFEIEELYDEQMSSQGQHNKTNSQGAGAVVAPMAGRVVKLFAGNGAIVRKGEAILVLEAMKMEHVVRAPIEGVVHCAKVEVGQQVSDNTLLCRIQLQEV